MSATAGWINGGVMIPDLLRAAPQTRPVLDRYGLRGCGGPLGPVETLEFFAQAHDVPLPALLVELRQASAASAASTESAPALADSIYRPFFKSAIAVVLTLGAAWGAYLLLRIGLTGSFGAAGLHEVNAHGHAQIFGWVGLFVMGFAYQAFPRFKHTDLAFPRLAYASGFMMLGGILVRSVGEPLAAVLPWAGSIAVAAALLELAAAGLVVGVIGATWRAALRDVQIHGFALLMVLGVSQRVLPNFYGFPAPNRGLSLAVLACLNI